MKETFDLGDAVICDLCGNDWTHRTESGGILFGSNACCPECAPQTLSDIARYNEERYIEGTCPPTHSFADWVRQVHRKGKPAKITIISL